MLHIQLDQTPCPGYPTDPIFSTIPKISERVIQSTKIFRSKSNLQSIKGVYKKNEKKTFATYLPFFYLLTLNMTIFSES